MTPLYFDEDFRRDAATPLREAGYEGRTTGQERRLSALDPDQLLFAVQKGWTLVTHNREDYKLLHRAWTLWNVQPPHPGILIMDQIADPAPLVAAIHAFLSASPPLANTLYLWTQRDSAWSMYTPT